MSVAAGIANRLYAAIALPERQRFERALRRPELTQRAVLARILSRNRGSEIGLRLRFGEITSVSQFRSVVAPAVYDSLAPDIHRMAAGERGVLTTPDLICFERTTGSGGASKLVPYTRDLLREFSAATSPWVFDLLHGRPALRDGCAYWAVTPPARANERTSAGIPVGMEHDSDYFPALARTLLDRVLGTPRALSRAPSIDVARYLTLRALLARPDLALISVWNPSFLTLLAQALDEHWLPLLHDLDTGALTVELDGGLRRDLARALPARPSLATALRRRFGRRTPEDLGALWPRLALISCWAECHAARALEGMTRRFPRVEIQGKGLLATEGVVSIPLFAAGGAVAAVTSHFLEFLPEGGGDAREVHELETGRCYEVLLTTSGGLYRYRLEDLVRVEGWHHRAPVLSFRGRADGTSDLTGEKLSHAFAESVLRRAAELCGVRPRFAMLAPAWGNPPAYRLFVEHESGDVDRLALAVESALMESHHYTLSRQLGQLGAVVGVAVVGAEATYERVCLARGQRAGAIKPVALDGGLAWAREFESPADAGDASAAHRGVA